MTRKILIFFFLFLCGSLLLLNCKKSEEKYIPFLNPLDSCRSTDNSGRQVMYDHINNLSFNVEPQWKITFNDSQKVTGGIDTIASDRHSQVRTFTISTTSSKLNLYDFFVEELKFMKKDSTVNILLLGKYTVDNQPALYSIIKMKEGNLTIKMTFFYVKMQEKIVIVQLGINENEPAQNFCNTMYIINSLTFKPFGLTLSDPSQYHSSKGH